MKQGHDKARTGRKRAKRCRSLGSLRGITVLAGVGLMVVALLPSTQHWARAGNRVAPVADTSDRDVVTVALSQSRVVKLTSNLPKIEQVSVANQDIADIIVIDPGGGGKSAQIYIVGKNLGVTNMILWGADSKLIGRPIVLEVTPDLALLKSRLYEVMPGEQVAVRSAQGSLVLSGTVSTAEKAAAAQQLASSFSNGAAVLNLLQIGGSQQVMLEVRVAEITRSLVKRLDINFTGLFGGDQAIRIGTGGTGTTIPVDDNWSVGIPAFSSQDRALFLNSLGSDYLLSVVIDAAKNNGLAKILAEPNLTTLSGQEANFLAGGEFPIPVPQENGNTTIEYKDYGVGLQFIPVVLDSGLISVKVNVTVSELTSENAVTVGTGTSASFFVPALTKRSANATVEVTTGETIAIAGLISERLRENVDKFPGLGDVPVLGTLFRSQEFVKGQTELMIFVTPRLARSYSPDYVRLPTDDFVEPDDLEFYLMGRLEACKDRSQRTAFTCTGGGMSPDTSGSEGYFGHDL